MVDFDYVITGSGCAGLSLLMRMLSEPALHHKRILLVERSTKTVNDRTWCFWEKKPGFFEEIVAHRWSYLWFHGAGKSRLLDAGPYTYKMIRGIDFYRYCYHIIRKHSNVTLLQGRVEGLQSDEKNTFVVVDGRRITADRIFNSIPFFQNNESAGKHWQRLQHFKGWVIRTPEAVFTAGEATLMDFRTGQDQGMAFFYVMPFSPYEALVEYTVFSGEVLEEDAYTSRLIEYIRQIIGIRHYSIVEREMGVIPMTTKAFERNQHKIHHIGAAAGLTKPSTGYTFQPIQRDSERLVDSLVQLGVPDMLAPARRFHFYDRILLNVLVKEKIPGDRVFSHLFLKNTLPDLFAFLDNASSPIQDWKIIRSLPVWPFASAALGECFGAPPLLFRGVQG